MKLITNFQGQGLQQAEGFIESFQAKKNDEVIALLKWITEHQNQGHFISGYFSYEAMQAFDKSYKTKKNDFPLAKFFAFKKLSPISNKSSDIELNWDKEVTEQQYLNDIKKILHYIYEGDVYQINYSFRQFSKTSALDWQTLFLSLIHKQDVPYASLFIDEEEEMAIISLSPELFLARQGNTLTSKPMKGTIKRGLYLAEDNEQKYILKNDSKSQAENIMIVDLMRNDFSKICQLHSVKVKNKFEIKTFKTLHQMVTTVKGQLEKDTSLFDILKATFPAGSITGTPKKRAIEIIDELEQSPRNIYTGSMALFLPHGDFILNVAIRTLLYFQDQLELGLGSGIVANSEPSNEWEECLLKSNFLNTSLEYDYFFETILFQKDYINLELHLERLKKSTEYFQQEFNQQNILNKLNNYKKQITGNARVRLYLYKNGQIKLEDMPTSVSWDKDIIKIKISTQKVNSQDIYLYHKTNKRPVYTKEFKLAQQEGYDEVIFFNENGYLTEGSISNIFIKNQQGQWQTPAINNGLLAGTMRQQLLQKLTAQETTIDKQDLQNAQEIIICNSIRQTTKATL